ncbi:HEPN domain-containing protein [Veronia pacifica]|uniref:Apea-like HEPN domain-containing protein n=1 Tax=Veronia pacifica TaxID=1080227 RepID=A0A1C3ERN7_9GAMM|nr:HEPN domain-containing protein [Veronia pacifica]ODA35886.1 hypothetical protein A8L45_02300 [Veronia pacifica]
MKHSDINLDTEIAIDVRFQMDNIELHGTLSVALNVMARVTVSSLDLEKVCNLEEGYAIPSLKCTSVDGDYTLIDCKYFSGEIYPEFIVKGHFDFDFDTIVLGMFGLSTWFENSRPYRLSNEGLHKDFGFEKFSHKVTFKGVEYEIENQHSCTIKNQDEKNFLVLERDSIQIKCLDKNLTLQDVKSLSWKMKVFLSILSASSLPLQSVHLINKDTGYQTSLYFFESIVSKTPIERSFHCFCTGGYLFREGLWEKVMTNYFAKESFEQLWPNLYGIFTFEGSWQFDFMSHVILLDRYCSLIAENTGFRLASWDTNDLKAQLDEEVEKYAEGTYRDKRQCVNKIIKHVKAAKREPNFSQKYENAMKYVSSDVKKLIAFSEDDFDLMKTIRDQVSHGSQVKTKEPSSIRHEMIRKDRLLVLLLYLVFDELGFTRQQFASCLSRCKQRFVHNAHLDDKEIEKLTKNIEVLPISHAINTKIYPSFRRNIVVIFDPDNQTYAIDQEASDLTQTSSTVFNRRGSEHIIESVRKSLSEKGYSSFDIVQRAYLSFDGNEHSFTSVIKVSR